MKLIFCTSLLLLLVLEPQAQTNVFPTSGNVGIGTSSPSHKLDVIGAAKADQFGFPHIHYNFALSPRTQLNALSVKLFDDYVTHRPGGASPGNNNYGTLIAIYGRVSHWQTDLYFGASDKKMYFRTSAWSGGTSENGVGGFNNWRTLLDSHSDVKSSGKLQLSGGGSHYIESGNLGIGTSNPSERLAVNGNIRAKEIKVETANWPDYVFKEGYELKSLAETEKYIKDNGHLPEVPKAEEVEVEGISLGEMNKLLLKKIEELTLHAIEQQKRIKKLEAQVFQNSCNEKR